MFISECYAVPATGFTSQAVPFFIPDDNQKTLQFFGLYR
jgi:hypothetical protein